MHSATLFECGLQHCCCCCCCYMILQFCCIVCQLSSRYCIPTQCCTFYFVFYTTNPLPTQFISADFILILFYNLTISFSELNHAINRRYWLHALFSFIISSTASIVYVNLHVCLVFFCLFIVRGKVINSISICIRRCWWQQITKHLLKH